MRLSKFIVTCFALVFISNSFSKNSNKLLLRFIGDTEWSLETSAHQNFVDFLHSERLDLLIKIPDLKFPSQFSSLKNSILSYGIATNKKYKNRNLSCSFLEKIKGNLTSDIDKKEFQELTKDGHVCIQRDLNQSELNKWSIHFINFIWLKKWIPVASDTLSLEEYLIKRIGIKNYIRPQIKILTSTEYDAYGYNFSDNDRKVIANSKKLSEVFEITKNFTPNDLTTFGDLGPEIMTLLRDNPTSIGGMFITQPTIFITNNWAPSDLPEILAHEFGHVYHGNFKDSIIDKGDIVEIKNSRIHDEGAAEAVAWFSLCKLYDLFPEMKFFHLFKLTAFSQLKKNDPHFVGAASFSNQFHYQCPNSSEELHRFLAAKSLNDFMSQINYFPINKISKKDGLNVNLTW